MMMAELGRLHVEMLLLHGTEEEEATSAGAAEIEELVQSGQRCHLILDLDKAAMKERVQLDERDVGQEFLVKLGEG